MATILTSDISAVADVLLGGGVAVIPTDTVYGVAASLDHLEAVRRLFVVKQRPESVALPVMCPDTASARALATSWSDDAAALADAFWPGPLTLIVPTDAARADSVPNLEIETGEIAGAGHASATGRFDDEQLFYLQSRGIPADVATRLVVRGFFADVIYRLGVPEWEDRLASIIDTELGLTGTDDAGDDE